jgi:hypothetical protein
MLAHVKVVRHLLSPFGVVNTCCYQHASKELREQKLELKKIFMCAVVVHG